MKNLIVFFSFFYLLQSCTEPKLSSKIIALQENQSIQIKNISNQTACFELKSTSIPASKEAILNEVNLKTSLFENEPKHIKAWRYVIENLSYQPTGFESFDFHHPILLLNSIGYGQCDDLASVLHFIWEMQGLDSRVWQVGNHVVAEVFADDKWQMFDPSFQVFYYNKNGNIAGVEELINEPNLITNPMQKIDYFFEDIRDQNTIDSLRYSAQVANYYSKRDEVIIMENYSITYDIDTLLFCLPGNASLEFPIFEKNILEETNWYSESISSNQFLKLTLQKNSSGKLSIPLVAVKGQGLFELINSANKIISDKEVNQKFIDMNLELKEINKESTIYYKISKAWASSNEFVIKNFNANAISIQQF